MTFFIKHKDQFSIYHIIVSLNIKSIEESIPNRFFLIFFFCLLNNTLCRSSIGKKISKLFYTFYSRNRKHFNHTISNFIRTACPSIVLVSSSSETIRTSFRLFDRYWVTSAKWANEYRILVPSTRPAGCGCVGRDLVHSYTSSLALLGSCVQKTLGWVEAHMNKMLVFVLSLKSWVEGGVLYSILQY